MVRLLKIIGYPDANINLSDPKKSAPQNKQLNWHGKLQNIATNTVKNNTNWGQQMTFSQNRGTNTRRCLGCFKKCQYGFTTVNGKTYPMLGDTVIKSYKAPGDYTIFVNTQNATEALKLAVEISKLCDNFNHSVYKQR